MQDCCPECGEDLDISLVRDGTPVVCPACGRRGWVSADAESEAYVAWEDSA